MTETIEINFARPLPVFPLPGCVLLPHGSLKLHVFEPRYRRMVMDALDSSGLITMGLFDGPVSPEEYERGRPPLRSHVCVGYIEHYRPMHDGRYLLRLRGLCRAHIIREEPHEPYRRFLLEPTDLSQDEDENLLAQRARLKELLGDPILRRIEGVEDLCALLDKVIPTTALVDIIAMQVCEDPERRYPMLAEKDPHRRAVALAAHLDALRCRAESVDS